MLSVHVITLHTWQSVGDWEFYQDIDGQWFWRNITDGGARVSVVRFRSFPDVIASAMYAGFNPGDSNIIVHADRRSTPRAPEPARIPT